MVGGAAWVVSAAVPRAWLEFGITFRYHSARYGIQVDNTVGVSRGIVHVDLDGDQQPAGRPASGDARALKIGLHSARSAKPSRTPISA